MTKKDRDKRIKELKALMAPFQAEMADLLNEEASNRPHQIFKCGHCGKGSKVKDYIKYISYDITYDGDWDSYDEQCIICPKCNWKNRFLSEQSIKKWNDLKGGKFENVCERTIADIIGEDVVQDRVYLDLKIKKYYYKGKVVYDNFVNL